MAGGRRTANGELPTVHQTSSVFRDVGGQLDTQMEDGSEEERIAGGPEKRAVAIQFDDQRNRAIGWDVQFVTRRAVQDHVQIRSRNRKS